MHPPGIALRHVRYKQWLQFILDVLYSYKKYHMNIKCNCHVYKYDTGGSHDLHVSGCMTYLYQNGVFNMGIKLYNKMPEKSRLHSLSNFKKELKSVLLPNSFYTLEEYLQAAL